LGFREEGAAYKLHRGHDLPSFRLPDEKPYMLLVYSSLMKMIIGVP
jgi:hypothetical protein